MRAESENTSRAEPDSHGIPPSTIYSEPWWRGVGYNPLSTVTGANAINSSSQECRNGGSDSNDGQSLSNGGPDEGDEDAIKESQTAVNSRSDGTYRQEQQNRQHAGPTLARRSDNSLPQTPPSQLELVSHSIACATNPYQDPYYGGMMAAYPLVHPQLLGVHHARMPLPHEMAQEPVYVNAKQYHGILRRRQSRAKAELEKKLIKVRKPYLHESRHQHALRRARGSGGRFAKKVGNSVASNFLAEGKGPGSGSALSSQSVSSSGSEPLPSDSAEYWNCSSGQQESQGAHINDMSEVNTYVNGNGNGNGKYQNDVGLQASTFRSAKREDEGECSSQQWGGISSNQTSQRPVPIQ